MMKLIEVTFTDRLCDCREQNVSWNVEEYHEEKRRKTRLLLWCRSCGVKLIIPHESFRIKITFENPYPGKKLEQKEVIEKDAKILKLVPPPKDSA